MTPSPVAASPSGRRLHPSALSRAGLLVLLVPAIVVAAAACSGDEFHATPSPTAGAGGDGGGGAGAAGGAGASGGDAGAGAMGGSPTTAGSGGDAGAGGDGATAGSGGAGGGAGEAGSAGTSGAAGSSGAGGDAGTAGSSGAGAAGSAGSTSQDPCQILYVTAAGKADGALAGCSEKNPLGSLSAALERAAQRSPALPQVTEIRMCGGAYTEASTIAIGRAIAIHGGYACDSSPWSAPTDANATPTTISYSSTIGVRIDAPPSGGTVELTTIAFVPLGDAPVASATIGLQVTGGAPTVRRTHFFPPKSAGVSAAFGSVGLWLMSGAGGTFTANTFEAGPGTFTGAGDTIVAGSVGAILQAPASKLSFKRNTILGGTGTSSDVSRPGSIGLVVVASAASPISLDDNIVTGGTGRFAGAAAPTDAFLGSVGVAIAPGGLSKMEDVTLTGGAISPGSIESNDYTSNDPSFLGIDGRAAGVVARAPADLPQLPVTLERVRVYGGDVSAKDKQIARGTTFGILSANSRISLHSSLVHGGGVGNQTRYTRAVLSASSTWTIHGSTLLPGIASPAPPPNPLPIPDDPFSRGNALGFFLSGAGNDVTIRSSILPALVGPTAAFYGEGDEACGDTPGKGYLVRGSGLYWVPPYPDGDGKLAFFASGTQGLSAETTCIYEEHAPTELSATKRTKAHFAGENTDSVVAIEVAESQSTVAVPGAPPTILGCGTTKDCLKQLFSAYKPGETNPGMVLDTSGANSVVFTPACGTKVPNVFHAGGALFGAVDLDLTGTQRAGTIAPGAFDTSCP